MFNKKITMRNDFFVVNKKFTNNEINALDITIDFFRQTTTFY